MLFRSLGRTPLTFAVWVIGATLSSSASQHHPENICHRALNETNVHNSDSPQSGGNTGGATASQVNVQETYQSGKSAGRVWVLTHDEMIARMGRNEITPLDWIVVDRLPVSEDAFPVAGIVVSEPTPRGTHWDILAERMGFPMIRQDKAHECSVDVGPFIGALKTSRLSG